MQRTRAFTMIELIITVTIIVLLTTAAIAGSRNLLKNLRMNNAFNKLIFLVQEARAQARSSTEEDGTNYMVKFILGGESPNSTLFSIDRPGGDNADTTVTRYSTHDLKLSMSIQDEGDGRCVLSGTITFAKTTGEPRLICDDNTEKKLLKITLTDTRDNSSKSFSVHQAAGVPQY